MYLKSFSLCNFRKFRNKNNTINFVSSKNTFNEKDINLASGTTLIIGKNNSGKTTITNALNIILNKNCDFKSNDFNFAYLNELYEEYKLSNFKEFPKLIFEFLISVDNADNDLFTNIISFINIENTQSNSSSMDLKIIMKYEVKESIQFQNDFIELNNKKNGKISFNDFLGLIEKTEFTENYFNEENGEIIDEKIKLNSFINLEIVSANKPDLENLKGTFNKIINYKYKESNSDSIDLKIEEINQTINSNISSNENETINNILHKIESNKKLSIELSSNLTFDKLLNNLIKYEYVENKLNIPEKQFGLGYSNLMSILSKLIDYIEKYPDEKFHSKINLICVEEPEAFMHPQMQEQFINNINDAVKALLDNSSKKINTQLIITTHSSHILNSKIHTSNSFDNISYITELSNHSNIINLSNDIITGSFCSINESKEEFEKRKLNDLKFLKKHIKYKVSELFFSDAVILVEGITEETILPFYLNKDTDLNKNYLSIFNINGAHGLVYHSLIKILRIPALIITDIDIQRTPDEKGEGKDDKKDIYLQMSSLAKRITTNQTIVHYNPKNEKIAQIKNSFEEKNLKIVFQKSKIQGYHATSFEEAMILTNYDNVYLNNVLKLTKPNIYKNITEGDNKNLLTNSFKFQKKLSDSKSDFANNLLYELAISEDTDNIPELPKYIQDGINWLKKQLIK